MNTESLVADPLFVLLTWSGGVGLAGAAVTVRSVVGPGFTWLAAATSLLIGMWSAFTGDLVVGAAVVAVLVGGLAVRWSRLVSGIWLTMGAGLFAVAAAGMGGPMLAATATLALGGITGEMLLGHWYLIDPTLPRVVLRALAIAGLVGLTVDVLAVVVSASDPATGGVAVAFWVLAVTTAALMAAVIGALRYPAYSGVMAATGLSYLAVLTGLATVFLGRAAWGGTI